ncbi:hypothetical protein M758_5G167800 [Ceratodon purpureus]|uniref:DNA-directed RNA polymerases I and III subunit RPAC2 n=1 Tax=Ceratodon purpureus TaxID=3225 RepID=A0A8T0I4N5_CERPU|nr:hypothetical protein KC19_5G174700 [Ceratodon purpureus]KAG0617148.1 hypothetical protein M758_5G167800 [Ceratodon purpureus]
MAATMELGSDTDPRNATFSISDEDHTLGNSLRFVLNKDPRVAFCGYSVPHPSENRINVRVQTTGIPARDVLKDALNDLTAMNQHVMTTFDSAVERFKANQGMTELSMKSGVTSQHSGSVKKP